jgi:hypothetical protein
MTAASQSRIDRRQTKDAALAWANEDTRRFPTPDELSDRMIAKGANVYTSTFDTAQEFHEMLGERYRAAHR